MRQKKQSGRDIDNLVAAVAAGNEIIQTLSRRDGIDTSAYGLMVRRAGEKSIALHQGSHASEQTATAAHGSRDPRVPKAVVGMTLSGSLKTDFRKQIESRHDRLVELHRWMEAIGGRDVKACDYRWDPVLLALLRMHGADLDGIVMRGPGDFANPIGFKDRPSCTFVVEAPDDDRTPYLACIDGDVVRVEQIRYDAGIFYAWRREQPDHVELSIKDRRLPDTIMSGLMGAPFSTVVGHPSLAPMTIQSIAQIGRQMSFKTAARLERP